MLDKRENLRKTGRNGNGKDVDEAIRILEREMKFRYHDREPEVLKSPAPSNGKNGTLFHWPGKTRRQLAWAVVIFSVYFFFFPMARSVSLSGKVVAKNMRAVAAKVDGEIISLTKANGDFVKENEVVGRIYSAALRDEKKRLEAEINIFNTGLESLRKSSEGRLKLFSVYKRLYEEGDISRIQYEAEEIKFRETSGQFLVKEAELEEREVRLGQIISRLEGETVRSSAAGVVISPVREKLNTHIKEGEILAEVASGEKCFEFRVPQDALRSVRIGQGVLIKVHAFPRKEFRGRIETILPLVYEENPKPWLKTYNARIIVSSATDLPSGLRLGMSATAKLQKK